MRTEERRLQQLEERYWTVGGDDRALARETTGAAIAAGTRRPALLARAVQIAERADAPAPLQARIDAELVSPARRMRCLTALADALGDDNLPARDLVFEVLPKVIPELDVDAVDVEAVDAARAAATDCVAAAHAALTALGLAMPEIWADDLRLVLDDLADSAARFQASALVVASVGVGLVLGVSAFAKPGSTGVTSAAFVDLIMESQARTVLQSRAGEGAGAGWNLEWPLTYAGASIGLALEVAAQVAFANLPVDPLLGATGTVDDAGAVGWVDGIVAKVIAARDAGYRRALLPSATREQVEAAGLDDLPELLYVDHTNQIRNRLAHAGAKSDWSLAGRVRYARAELRAAGLDVQEPRAIPSGAQIKVADAQSKASVQLYEKGTFNVSGAAGTAKTLAEQITTKCFDKSDAKRAPQTFTVMDDGRRARIRQALDAAGAEPKDASGASEQWRVSVVRNDGKAIVTQWTTGKLMIQGEGAAYDDAEAAVRSELRDLANVPDRPKPAPTAASIIAELPRDVPWAGTDESGKGDYFGPLVSAAVAVDAQLASELDDLGVKDSKKLTDKRVHALAPQVRRLLAGRFDLTIINPKAYNKLYADFRAEGKNLNTLLAWGHARSIEDLIKKGAVPNYVIVDQFADAKYIEGKLLSDTRESGIRIVQFPKAEADVAVAAASVLAREAFLQWLARTSSELGMTIPKGASDQVVAVARAIVAARGEAALDDYVKRSFKTTAKVLAP